MSFLFPSWPGRSENGLGGKGPFAQNHGGVAALPSQPLFINYVHVPPSPCSPEKWFSTERGSSGTGELSWKPLNSPPRWDRSPPGVHLSTPRWICGRPSLPAAGMTSRRRLSSPRTSFGAAATLCQSAHLSPVPDFQNRTCRNKSKIPASSRLRSLHRVAKNCIQVP